MLPPSALQSGPTGPEARNLAPSRRSEVLARPLPLVDKFAGDQRPVTPIRSALHVSSQGSERPFLGSAPGRELRNLSNQLPEDGLAKRVEVLGDDDERSRTADHVVAIILLKPSRRIGVLGEP